MEFIDSVVKLFGRTINDPDVVALLSQYPSARTQKPNDGCQFVVCREKGFDLEFSGGRMPTDRKLTQLFLYSDKVDGHQQFCGALPFGFRFMQTHRELVSICNPDRTWVIGEGRVQAAHSAPDSATWVTEEFNLFASYSKGSIQALRFQIGPHKPLDIDREWKPAPIWQSCARNDDLVKAIKLYRDEHNVGMAEAKSKIE
jgi:hypothetical protein